MRVFLAVLVGVAFAGFVPAAPVPKAAKKPTTEQKLLGKWKLTESQANNIGRQNSYSFCIVFTDDGVMELRYEFTNGRAPQVYRGTYKVVDGDKVDYTVNDNGYKKAEVLVLDALTDDEIEWTDPDQKREKYVRVKDESK